MQLCDWAWPQSTAGREMKGEKKKGSPPKSPAHSSLFPIPLAEKKAFLLEFLLSVLAAQCQNSACPQVNSREKRKIKIHKSHPLWILNSSFHFNSQYTWYVYFSKSLGGGFLYSVVSFSGNDRLQSAFSIMASTGSSLHIILIPIFST